MQVLFAFAGWTARSAEGRMKAAVPCHAAAMRPYRCDAIMIPSKFVRDEVVDVVQANFQGDVSGGGGGSFRCDWAGTAGISWGGKERHVPLGWEGWELFLCSKNKRKTNQ